MSKAKALTLFMNKFNVKEAIRITEENFSFKKGIKPTLIKTGLWEFITTE